MNPYCPPTASFTPPFTPSAAKAQPSTEATLTARPMHMILDFDGTITQADTTYLIPEASRLQRTSHLLQHELLRSWESVAQKYNAALDEHSQRWAHVDVPTSMTELIAFQRSLRQVEERSATHCSELGLLGGLSDAAWLENGWKVCEGRRVKIRPGFLAMIEKLEARQPGRGKWGIVSVNWSQHFLRGILGWTLGDRGRAEAVPILSNHIDPVSKAVCGPPWPSWGDGWASQLLAVADRKRILTSEDKLEAMKSMRGSFTEPLLQGKAPSSLEGAKNPSEREPPRFIPPLLVCAGGHPPPRRVVPLLIYVGDSMTDLECLLDAEVGIIMAPDGRNSMLEVLGRCNMTVLHVAHYQPRPTKSLWFARDFVDIAASKLLDDGPPPPAM